MHFEGFPYVIGRELTLDCNLRCLHCASSAGNKRHDELSLTEALRLCGQFNDLLVQEVVFTGGEPLLKEGWDDIASELTRRDIRVGIVTNGLLIDETAIKKMLDSGITAIGVSLDGPNYIHDRIRNRAGAFETVMRNLEMTRKAGINVTAITSVTGLNAGLLDEIFSFVRECGAWKWQLQPFFPTGRGLGNEGLNITADQFLAIGKYIKEKRNRAKEEGIEMVPADSCGYFSQYDFEDMGWKGCGAGRFSCGIMSDGRIKGCLSWPDSMVEGNVRERELWDIWFDEAAFPGLRHYDATDMNGSCKDCKYALDCGGGCESMSLATTKMLHADPYCYYGIMRAGDASGTIAPDEDGSQYSFTSQGR